MWKKILNIVLNKYFLTTVAFLIWLFFFDSNNAVLRLKLKNQLNELQREKQFYLDEIQKDSILTEKLLNDTAELERFVREKYLMKKENEDVFLVIDTTPDLHQ
ncbi:MAG: septum formation initiator family protein [Bacteroidales bacterium]|nr:septum formation initiator family protein [Bacteroidota bacterium]MBL6950374.1 septum formation initiator family protein [Bacteroidales bacterium]